MKICKIRLTIVKIDKQWEAMRQETLPHVDYKVEFLGEDGTAFESHNLGGFVPDTLHIDLTSINASTEQK